MNIKATLIKMWALVVLILLLGSCKKDFSTKTPINDNPNNLNIPNGFDFSTSKTIKLNISDPNSEAVYHIYGISSWEKPTVSNQGGNPSLQINHEKRKIASVRINNGNLLTQVSLPRHYKNILLERKAEGTVKRFSLDIQGKSQVSHQYTPDIKKKAGNTTIEEMLYGVNTNSQLFSINPLNMQVNELAILPVASIANTVNPVTGEVLFAQNEEPFGLYKYNIQTQEISDVIGNFDMHFPRMAYNAQDNLIYYGDKDNNIYTYDIDLDQTINTYPITNILSTAFGDICFDGNNDLFLVNKESFYRLDFNDDNTISATDLNQGDGLSYLTSLGIDSQGIGYVAHSGDVATLHKFNIASGQHEEIALSQTIKINDLGMHFNYIPDPIEDADGDGVADEDDDYPNDPNKAFNNYFPGEGITATIAFEDLWPARGDYDFNDLVANYSFNKITNADNEVVELDISTTIKHIGASFSHGMGYELPFDPTTISLVEGSVLNNGNVLLASNGLEDNQGNKAVVIAFEDCRGFESQETLIKVYFNENVDNTGMEDFPYNPFIYIQPNRAKEIHLPNHMMTNLGDQSFFNMEDDQSSIEEGKSYIGNGNLPWAINIPYDFDLVVEKSSITNAYLKFVEWAQSNGEMYPDWYIDQVGYRNPALIMPNNQ